VSLTVGSIGSRQHIWTFVGSLNEQGIAVDWQYNCPCSNTNQTWENDISSLIGNDYFCDTGNRGPGINETADGEGCGPTSSCCEFNSPPWFCKSLPQPTTDDLELRLCNIIKSLYEDKIISLIDIFVK